MNLGATLSLTNHDLDFILAFMYSHSCMIYEPFPHLINVW